MKALFFIGLLSLTSLTVHAECYYAVHASCDAADYDDTFKNVNFNFVATRTAYGDNCSSLSSIETENLARHFLESNYDIASICKIEVLDPDTISTVGPTTEDYAIKYSKEQHLNCISESNTEACYRYTNLVNL